MKSFLQTVIVLLFFFCQAVKAQNQLKTWYIAPQKADVTVPSPVFTPIGGAPNSNQINNGMYDSNGNLLFYFSDNSFTAGTIYDRNNNTLHQFGYPFVYASNEIVIVPFVNNDGCLNNKFYVFRASPQPQLTPSVDLVMVIIDMNLNNGLGGTVGGEISIDNIPSSSVTGGEIGGIAVGREINGQRYMYFCGGRSPGRVDKFVISAPTMSNPTGVSAPTMIFTNTSTTIDLATQELDLSPDGTKLAWAAGHTLTFTFRYCILNLDANGNFNGNLQAFNVGTSANLSVEGGRGVEFDATSTKLFVGAGANGIFVVNPSNLNANQISGTDWRFRVN